MTASTDVVRRPLLTAAVLGLLTASTQAAPQAAGQSTGPIRDALVSVDDEVRTYNDHLTILASPWMEGRQPGTRGMELAKEYMEYHFRQYGLQAPYDGEVLQVDGTTKVEANASYRQPFELGQSAEILTGELTLDIDGEQHGFERGRDQEFTVTGLGSGGAVTAPMVYVGYGIDAPEFDYSSFGDESLEGKIAVMLRFEPFHADGERKGKSLWKEERAGWTQYASFAHKLEQVAARGAVGAIIINTPEVSDRRSGRLYGLNNVSLPKPFEGPVLHMSTEAGDRFFKLASGGSLSLADVTAAANAGDRLDAASGSLNVDAIIDRQPLSAENIVAVLPGKGALASEKIVVGAHLDHLGMGDYGSRDSEAGMKLHPGADDNATGCAGILLIAQKMAKDYASAPADANLRSIVFIGFSAEETGLDGSKYYAENPLGSLGSHKLMMNFDMIGRMTDSRVKLSGTWTADGLAEFVKPIAASSPLTVVEERQAGGGSDHQMFYRREVPVLFSIIADFHGDYHTSRDVSWLINRVEAVQAANLFYEIASAYAEVPDAFPYVGRKELRERIKEADAAAEEAEEAEQTEGAPALAKVRLGVVPVYNADEEGRQAGVLIDRVGEASPAEEAGLAGGDRLVTWNGEEVEGPKQLGALLRNHEPGDVVKLGVDRDGKAIEVEVTLTAR